QRVVTEGAGRGTLGGHWVANETIEPNQEKGTGVFTTASGSFGIDLHSSGEGAISRLAEVKSGLTEASLLAPDQSHGVNRDQATSIDTFPTSNRNGASNAGTQIVYTAGSPITQLTNGLYAARYGHYLAEELDSQAAIAPWNEPMTPAPFWTQASNTGLRLFKEDGSVVTTIGGQPAGHPCNLDTPQLSVAAGAGESLFVLTQPNEAHANSDDQVIEFAPGGAGACPVPSISEVKVTQNGAEEVKGLHGEAIVHAGAPVAFKVSGLNRVGETPFEFDWNVTGATSGGSHNDGFTLVSKIEAANSYKWPSPATEYQYSLEEVGPHEGKVRLIGDFGAITVPFQVDVLGSGNPTAEFTGPGSAAEGQSVAFDGSSSKPTPGSSIVEYRWEFSDDGSQHERESPQESHTFAHAGTYNVKLTIFDAAGHEATVTKEVTVTATACPTSTCGGGGGGGGTVTTTATTSTTPPPPPPPPPVGAVASFGSTVTGGAVAVDVSCPAGNVSCSGTVQLRSIGALAAKKRKSKAPVILGQASFSVPGGHSATVRVHLSSKATAALKKAHTLHVTAIITTTVAGRMQTHTVNVTLRAKAVKGKHH
ncbi:MAG TPA: PKD domain-containing protein, partial [Solirubrobacteraceae bacterium]|nr:PKD domain-containing protein [Solirubrobacteraceae bacterium]